jgi:hypothetical protein
VATGGRTDANDAGAGKTSIATVGNRSPIPAYGTPRTPISGSVQNRNEGDSRQSQENGEKACASIRPGIAGHLSFGLLPRSKPPCHIGGSRCDLF